MSRTLVIGGTLFIGRALVQRLLERGDDVVIMHRGRSHPFGDRVSEIRCDRNDVAAVRAALARERFDVVYDNVYDWQRGTSAGQVLAAAQAAADGLRRYVFTSSVAVYPEGEGHDEGSALVGSDDANVYGAQKADSERALFELHRARNVPVSTLRPAFIYGPNNPYERETFFWDRILLGRPIIVPGDGERTMQFVHVDDVARAATLAADTDAAIGRAYTLASWPPVTQVQFVRLLAAAAGREAEIVHIPRDLLLREGGGLSEPPLYFGDYLDLPPKTARADRVRSELGLELTPLEDGMRETFRWYERQRRPAPDVGWEDGVLARLGRREAR